MKNFVFISPNFPTNYWKFCHELKQNGLNVLGIGDQPYDELLPELKASLTEYYKVDNLEDYEAVYRGVAFLIFKHGKIDWLESNNEYWLERDAMLRTAFNIESGFHTEDMEKVKFKSKMKAYYEKAGIPVARYYLVEDIEGCKEFIKKVGYPVVAKPDNGVGASDTWKIEKEADLKKFIENRMEGVQYIMEEFIFAEINSYDAIMDSQGNPIFETGNVTPMSIMDIVNNQDNSLFYIVNKLPNDVIKAGRATVKSFGVKSRFVHFEFFRLTQDQEGMGKKGDVVALEVNMRPCGGYSPDMMNYANSTNVYKIYADMIAFDKSTLDTENGEHFFCTFAGLRDNIDFKMSHEDIMEKYGENVKMVERIPKAFAAAMADKTYIATFSTKKEMDKFFKDVTAVKPAKKTKK